MTRYYRHGTKSPINRDAPSAKGAAYILRAVLRGEAPRGITLRHADACVRCGRALTTPESVDTGYGPECAAKLGIDWATREGADGKLDAGDLCRAIEAGRATFTATSQKTGRSFTYKVSAPRREGDDRRFVKVLTGQDNVGDYTYLGTIFAAEEPAPQPPRGGRPEVDPRCSCEDGEGEPCPWCARLAEKAALRRRVAAYKARRGGQMALWG